MDFGLASVIQSTTLFSEDVYEMTGGTGSLRYMAPEVATSRPYNHKADVYSFGIILWRLLSCEKPFVGYDIEKYFNQVVYKGVRPSVDSKWPKELKELMIKCWDTDIENRPSSKEIVTSLDSICIDSTARVSSRRRLWIPKMRRKSITY